MSTASRTSTGTASAKSTSGIEYIKYAASGHNRFVTLIALLAALGGFLFGYDTGIIGQALPFVQKQFNASTIVSSWIVASVLIGAIVGAAGSGYLADRISRKWTKFISGCVFVVGAILEATAQSAAWLITARLILGLAVGTASFVAPEYIAEQTPPKIRGGTVSYNQLMITLGKPAWTLAGDTATPPEPRCGVRLLPYFDAYVVAGQPRELLFPGVAASRALTPAGQAGNYPVLLIDGVAGGVWHRRGSGGGLAVTVEPFRELTPSKRRQLDNDIGLVGAVMGRCPR